LIFLSKSNTPEREKKKKKKFSLFNKSGDRKDAQSGEESENEPENSEPLLSYELVTQHESKLRLCFLLKYSSHDEMHRRAGATGLKNYS